MPSVILIDDEEFFLSYLEKLLTRHGIDVTGTFINSASALAFLDHTKVDVVLLDVEMPECSGLETIDLIRAQSPTQPILMISSLRDDSWLREALRRGANGFVTKSIHEDEFIAAVDHVSRGSSYVQGRALQLLINDYQGTEIPKTFRDQIEQLTEIQLDIWVRLCQAKSNRAISTELYLAESTVKEHVSKIFRTLGVRSRAEAIRQAADCNALEFYQDKRR